MLSLWNLYLLLPLSVPHSLHVIAFTGENGKETRQADTDTAAQRLTQPPQRPHGSGLAPGNVDSLGLPLSWPLSSSEGSDRQGVIGEYGDLEESTESSILYPNEKGRIISTPTDRAIDDATSYKSTLTLAGGVSPQLTQEQISKNESAETSTGSLLHLTETKENQPTFPVSQNETTNSLLPSFNGSLLSNEDSTSLLSAEPEPSPERPTPPVATSSWGWTKGPSVITREKTQEGTVPVKETGDGLIDMTDRILNRGAVTVEADKSKSPRH